MSPELAWAVIIGFWALPVLHVLVSKRSGGWRPPPGSRCPLGPRAGWFVMTVCLGLIGWLMFARWAYGRRKPEESIS